MSGMILIDDETPDSPFGAVTLAVLDDSDDHRRVVIRAFMPGALAIDVEIGRERATALVLYLASVVQDLEESGHG